MSIIIFTMAGSPTERALTQYNHHCIVTGQPSHTECLKNILSVGSLISFLDGSIFYTAGNRPSRNSVVNQTGSRVAAWPD